VGGRVLMILFPEHFTEMYSSMCGYVHVCVREYVCVFAG